MGCCGFLPVTGAAQGGAPGTAEDIHVVEGRVLRPGVSDLVPMPGLWVVLHRIGSDRAGAVDSIRTDARGAYRFRYVPTGDERAIYFAAASFGGVAYFTPPLGETVRGEPAEIVVYDTTSGHVSITVRGRHIVISAADANELRSVMEVYELSNDTAVTRVSPTPESAPTWRTSLPTGARAPSVTDGDVPREAVVFDNGEVRVVSPIPPGVKQLAYSYTLPASAFPLSIPIGAATDVYEILVEDPAGSARGGGLSEVDPVTIRGRRFRRFLAQDVAFGAISVVDVPRLSRGRDTRYMIGIIVLVGGTLVFALARALRRA